MRATPLIVVATPIASKGDALAARLRQQGNVVYVTRSAQGCLRVATSIGPDVVVLDPALPLRLQTLLHAHPASARARIVRLDDPSSVSRLARASGPQPVSAGPRAA